MVLRGQLCGRVGRCRDKDVARRPYGRRAIIFQAAGILFCSLSGLIGGATLAQAEDLKSRWYTGGSLAFLSTTDDIRSNAAIFLGSFGDDGLPGTGDPNENSSCDDPGVFCDPRPDDQLGRRTGIEETYRLDLTVGYGITTWLSVQVDAGYFRGNVGPLDLFVSEAFPMGSGSGYTVGTSMLTSPGSAGELIEIPIALTALIRMNTDHPLNPYVGFGGGMILADLQIDPDVASMNDRLRRLRIKGKSDEFGRSLLLPSDVSGVARGRVPLGAHAVTVAVRDGYEWHLTGGAEYFVNDRVSVVFDTRYVFSDQNVQILLGEEDQVDFTIFAEHLFRPDTSLKYFNHLGAPPNPVYS